MSGVEINSILTEMRLFKPSAEFTANAPLNEAKLKGLHQQAEYTKKMVAELREWLSDQIGVIAKPGDIHFSDGYLKHVREK